MVVVDCFTGKIQSFMRGFNPKLFGYNCAWQVRRVIGSLSKPITYLKELSYPKKYHLHTWIPDFPIAIKLNNSKFQKIIIIILENKLC